MKITSFKEKINFFGKGKGFQIHIFLGNFNSIPRLMRNTAISQSLSKFQSSLKKNSLFFYQIFRCNKVFSPSTRTSALGTNVFYHMKITFGLTSLNEYNCDLFYSYASTSAINSRRLLSSRDARTPTLEKPAKTVYLTVCGPRRF